MENHKMALLSCTNLVKSYFDGNRELKILKGVDLQVEYNQSVSIMGASGCGKSTLLNIIGQIDNSEQGQIILEGQNLSILKTNQLDKIRNKKIGLVFQSYHLIPELTAIENVMLPFYTSKHPFSFRKICQTNAENLLKKVGLMERKEHKPSKLSGGEQQRVAIARALLFTPPLLLCDEPTGHLDQSTGRMVLDLLLDLQKSTGISMIIVTHDPIIASKTDKQKQLIEGKII